MGGEHIMQNVMTETLRVYQWPSQAFWRYFEVQALRDVQCARPILEIGCGDGRFTRLVFQKIDDAIDINPRSVEKCRKLSGIYDQVRCLDARELTLKDGGFATVYANCVLEHIPQLSEVLAACYRGLRPGGQLVITVPLARMNNHLLFPWQWYARLRQKQLSHINLHSEFGWGKLLQQAGFSDIEFHSYLSGSACKFWDALDSPGCIGFGRYRVAAVMGILGRNLLPGKVRSYVIENLSSWLISKAKSQRGSDPACAALVLARKVA
jgi:SAM-dependent methyltransferase